MRVTLFLLIAVGLVPQIHAAGLSFDFANDAQRWSGVHVPSGGNPGGYITAEQSIAVDPGPYFGAFTPSVNYGDVAPGALVRGAEVSFDWRYDIATQGSVIATPGALVVDFVGPSGYLTASFLHGGAPNTWTQTEFLLTETGALFFPFGPGGQIGYLSESDFQAFLPTVTQILLLSNTSYQPGDAGGAVTARLDLDNFQVVATPEPGSWTLLLIGLPILLMRQTSGCGERRRVLTTSYLSRKL